MQKILKILFISIVCLIHVDVLAASKNDAFYKWRSDTLAIMHNYFDKESKSELLVEQQDRVYKTVELKFSSNDSNYIEIKYHYRIHLPLNINKKNNMIEAVLDLIKEYEKMDVLDCTLSFSYSKYYFPSNFDNLSYDIVYEYRNVQIVKEMDYIIYYSINNATITSRKKYIYESE